MKHFTSLLVLVFLVASICCSPEKKTDPEIFRQLLTSYFDGIKHRDVAKMNSLTTSDFVLFEDGRVWNNDSLVNYLNRNKSFDGEWTFDNLRINVDKSSADAILFNHGELTINDTLHLKFDWIESVMFRKVGNDWKINLYHSTVRK